MPCTSLPGALVLQAAVEFGQVGSLVREISGHLGLPLNAAELEQIAADLAAIRPVAETEPAWSSDQSTIVEGAVNAYLEHFRGSGIGTISWGRDLFFTDDHRPATGPIDITGRSRALIYGPYIRLPHGSWAAEVVLGVSPETSDMDFLVDVKIGDTVLSATNISPGKEGIFSVNLVFTIKETDDYPVEFRIMNQRAAFDGKVMLGHATLSLLRTGAGTDAERLRVELELPSE